MCVGRDLTTLVLKDQPLPAEGLVAKAEFGGLDGGLGARRTARQNVSSRRNRDHQDQENGGEITPGHKAELIAQLLHFLSQEIYCLGQPLAIILERMQS